MRIIFYCFLTTSLLFLSACQHFDFRDSLGQEKELNIAVINSENYLFVQDAQCSIKTDTEDSMDTHKNPDAILINTGYKTLYIDCQASGYQQMGLAITNTLGKWSEKDLFILPPGNIVNTADNLLPYYPSHILVLMNKKPFADQERKEKQYTQAQIENTLYQGKKA